MKNITSVLIILFVYVLYMVAIFAESEVQLGARILSFEQGLRSPFGIEGWSFPAMTIRERPRYYKVSGVSISVINNGLIEWVRGYGDLDAESPVSIKESNLLWAASISKPVFTMAMPSLIEKGELELDGNVNLKTKSWKIPENECKKRSKVKLWSLRTHTAGTSPGGFGGYPASATVPTLFQIMDCAPPSHSVAMRVNITPDAQFRYSGEGMIVAQQLVKEVTEQPLPNFMQAAFLGLLAMTHSTFEQPLPSPVLANAASAHNSDGHPLKGMWHTYPEQVAADLWSTHSDLARHAIELQGSYAGTSNKVLSREVTRQMLANSENNPFGLGIVVSGP